MSKCKIIAYSWTDYCFDPILCDFIPPSCPIYECEPVDPICPDLSSLSKASPIDLYWIYFGIIILLALLSLILGLILITYYIKSRLSRVAEQLLAESGSSVPTPASVQVISQESSFIIILF